MGAGARYTALVSSLPHLVPPFAARERPLSRAALDRRLGWLGPADARTLADIEALLRPAPKKADEALTAEARRLVAAIAPPDLREAVRRRLEQRTLIAALRRRHNGEGPPPAAALGYHRAQRHIRGHWTAPGFGLPNRSGWLTAAETALRDGPPVALEGLMIQRAWRDLARLGAGHWFDFTAVAFYVLRWDMVDRWLRAEAAGARKRFDNLVAAALDTAERPPSLQQPDLQQEETAHG